MGEDRRRPALLAGEHRLVVPVGALDEAHGERPAAAAAPGHQGLEVVARVAQVGLHDHAGLVVGAKLLFVEQLGEDGVGEVAVAELLEVEVDEGAARHGPAHDRSQGVLDGVDRAAEVERVDLRVERGDLDRDVDPGSVPQAAWSTAGAAGQEAASRGEVVEQVEVALAGRPRASRALTEASPSTSIVKPTPSSRRVLRPGSAERASLPTMKRRANESISARTTRVAAGRSGERRPAAPIARRSARGGSTPGCRKYSRRWRAISAPSPSVGKTSTKRKSSTLRRSSAIAQSIISSCQRVWVSRARRRERSTSANRLRAVACTSASRASASPTDCSGAARRSTLSVVT